LYAICQIYYNARYGQDNVARTAFFWSF